MVKPVLILLFGIALVSCSLSAPPSRENYHRSVISVAAPGFQLKGGDSVAWRAPIDIISRKNSRSAQTIPEQLKQGLESALQERGILIAEQNTQARYLIEGALILDNSLSRAQLVQRFDLAPALFNGDEFNANILILRIVHPYTHRTLWRGAVELFSHNSTAQGQLQAIQQAVTAVSRSLIP